MSDEKRTLDSVSEGQQPSPCPHGIVEIPFVLFCGDCQRAKEHRSSNARPEHECVRGYIGHENDPCSTCDARPSEAPLGVRDRVYEVDPPNRNGTIVAWLGADEWEVDLDLSALVKTHTIIVVKNSKLRRLPEQRSNDAPTEWKAATIANGERCHLLKTWPFPFEDVKAGRKPFEYRKHDRDYRVGDVLVLEKWDPNAGRYQGAIERRRVTYLLPGDTFGVPPGYCVMGLGPERDARVDKASSAEPPEDWADGVDAAAGVARAELANCSKSAWATDVLKKLVKQLEGLAEHYPGRAQRSDYVQATELKPGVEVVLLDSIAKVQERSAAYTTDWILEWPDGSTTSEDEMNLIVLPAHGPQVFDRGRLINEHATTGMHLVELCAALPEVEKQARKTPRRDMPEERAKVEAAKARIGPMKNEIARLDELHRKQRVRLGSAPCTANLPSRAKQ